MQQRTRTWWPLALACALLLGAGLRLVWVEDMEYKYDEWWTFAHTQDRLRTHDQVWLGLQSSAGIPNPGLSLWIFQVAARAFAIHEPTGLARAVQAGSILALGLLVGFVLVAVPRPEREAWLWAAALLALNPLAVLFHRKIWTPSSLPLLTTALLAGWWYRRRPAGAFVWGLVGALLGQIHGSGFFFAAGFFGWALLFDRRRVAWPAWLIGSSLGALPMVPWVWYLATTPHESSFEHQTWLHVWEFKFWTRWATESLGWGTTYSVVGQVRDFMAYPQLAGRPTYFVGLLHGLIAVAALLLLARALLDWRQGRYAGATLADRLIGRHSPTAFTLGAALWGFGLVMTFTCLPIHRHYMVILFPLEFLWLARLALGPTPPLSAAPSGGGGAGPPSAESVPAGAGRQRFGRAFLAGVCTLQLALSITYLAYIHTHQGTQGDYGPAYGSARNAFRTR